MALTLAISITTFVCIIISIIFFPSIKMGKFKISLYWIIGLIGATILLITQQVSFADVWNGLTSESSMNPLKILALFISMTYIPPFWIMLDFFLI